MAKGGAKKEYSLEDIKVEEDFASELAKYEKREAARLSKGRIERLDDEKAIVSVPGEKMEGFLNKEELEGTSYKVGDEIPVIIIGRARSGAPQISYKRAVRREKLQEYIKKLGDNYKETIVEGKVIRRNKGGFVVECETEFGKLEFFMPKYEAAFKDDAKTDGKAVKALIINVKPDEDSVVISRKRLFAAESAGKRENIEKLLAQTGILKGVVKKITTFGMFVDIDGTEGLVHYTEISHKGPVNPAKLYKEGDSVEVKVVSYDKEKHRLALSIRATQDDPWSEVQSSLEVGDAIKVVVSNIEPYGVFVDLGNDIEGFLHISEISWNKNIQSPDEFLKVGQEIDVEVIEIDTKARKLRVSLKKLLDKPFHKFQKTHKEGDVLSGEVVSLTDFGAFVKIGEVDGLLHNEDAFWDRAHKCKDQMKLGDKVQVKVAKIDAQKERISLSRKGLIDSPASEFAKTHNLDDEVVGKVRDVKDFGVFITLEGGQDALIRNEELAPLKKDEIKVGDEIKGVLSLIDAANNRIRVSITKSERKKERANLKQYNESSNDKMTLGDMIKSR